MQIISIDSKEFDDIADQLGEEPDDSNLEFMGGIDCDEDDRNTQREDGDEDPIATIELIAQCSLDSTFGIVDWFYSRESTADKEEPVVEHGGALLAFRKGKDDKEIDFDALLPHALEELNKSITWAEFAFEE